MITMQIYQIAPLQRKSPSPIIDDLAKDGKVKTPDIGDEGSKLISHKIYHFVVDTETFKTTHVEFASPFVKQMLGNKS